MNNVVNSEMLKSAQQHENAETEEDEAADPDKLPIVYRNPISSQRLSQF